MNKESLLAIILAISAASLIYFGTETEENLITFDQWKHVYGANLDQSEE